MTAEKQVKRCRGWPGDLGAPAGLEPATYGPEVIDPGPDPLPRRRL